MANLPMFRVYQDQIGEWRWTFYAANGRKIADSGEGYHNKVDCLRAMNILKNHARAAKVEGGQLTQADRLAAAAARRTGS